MNNCEIALIGLSHRLKELQFKITKYNEFMKLKNFEDILDYEIKKIIQTLVIKCLDLDEKSIKNNIDAFHFLLELWEKDISKVEDYFLDHYGNQELH